MEQKEKGNKTEQNLQLYYDQFGNGVDFFSSRESYGF